MRRVSAPSSAGALALAAFVVFGTTACSPQSAGSGDEPNTTTTYGSMDGGSTDGSSTDGSSADGSSTIGDETSESESTGLDTDDGPNDTSATGGSFYAGAQDISFSDCDPFEQDCPAGEKCVPYAAGTGAFNANKCVPINGDGAAGDPCTYAGAFESTDSCGAGLFCWNVVEVEGQSIGECTPLCQGSPDAPQCGPGTSCLITNNGSITLCLASCDPLLQDCGAGLGCYWTFGAFNCLVTSTGVALGEPCGYLNDCVAGSSCVEADAMPDCNGWGCCASFCELEANLPCPQPGTECMPFFEAGEAPAEYQSVGVCIVGDG